MFTVDFDRPYRAPRISSGRGDTEAEAATAAIEDAVSQGISRDALDIAYDDARERKEEGGVRRGNVALGVCSCTIYRYGSH